MFKKLFVVLAVALTLSACNAEPETNKTTPATAPVTVATPAPTATSSPTPAASPAATASPVKPDGKAGEK